MSLFTRYNKPIAGFLAITVMIAIVGLVVLPKQGKAVNRVYKSAAVTSINGKTYVVVTNEQGIETLELSGNRLLKRGEANVTGTGSTTYGVSVSNNGSAVFAYVAAGANILKFDITDPNWPVQELSVNYYGTAYDVANYGQNIVVAGTNGLTLFETNRFDIITRFTTIPAYGVNRASNGTMIAALDNEAVILDSNGTIIGRQSLSTPNYRLRQVYNDGRGNSFAPGDEAIIKLGTGKTFANWSGQSYAISGIDSKPDVYMVNGWGVYKLAKNDLKYIKHNNLHKKNLNAWATGVKAFSTSFGKRVVVMSGAMIYLMDTDLKILDTYTYKPYPSYGDEDVSIASAQLISPQGKALTVWTDRNEAEYNTIFTAYGSGFWAGEEITAEFGPYAADGTLMLSSEVVPNKKNNLSRAWADANGNVSADIFVKEFSKIDAKVRKQMTVTLWGKNSKKRYSTTIWLKPEVIEKKEELKEGTPSFATKETIESKCEVTRSKTTEQIVKDGKSIEVEKVVETKNCTDTTTRPVVK